MKRYTHIFLFILCLSVLGACTNNKNEESKETPLTEANNSIIPTSENCTCCEQDSILEMILNIPEIQILAKYLYKETNGKHGAAAIIFSPDESSDSYTVNVGLNGQERFETMYLFNVDKKTCAISIDDIIGERTLSLDEWQEKEKKHFEYLKFISEGNISDKWYGKYYIYVPTEETTTVKSSISYTFIIDKDGCQLETNPIHNPIRCNGAYSTAEDANILTLTYLGDETNCNAFKIRMVDNTCYINGVGGEDTFNDWLLLLKDRP